MASLVAPVGPSVIVVSGSVASTRNVRGAEAALVVARRVGGLGRVGVRAVRHGADDDLPRRRAREPGAARRRALVDRHGRAGLGRARTPTVDVASSWFSVGCGDHRRGRRGVSTTIVRRGRRAVDVARGVDRAHLERVRAVGQRGERERRRAGRERPGVDPALERRAGLGRAERQRRRRVVGRAGRARCRSWCPARSCRP